MMHNIISAGIAGSIWGIGAILFKLTLSSFNLLTLLGFLFCGALGFVFFQASLKLGEATEANAFMMSILVLLPFFYGIALGGEALTMHEGLGIACVLVGAFIIILRQGRNRRIF